MSISSMVPAAHITTYAASTDNKEAPVATRGPRLSVKRPTCAGEDDIGDDHACAGSHEPDGEGTDLRRRRGGGAMADSLMW